MATSKRAADIGLAAIHIEGSLIAPAEVFRIAHQTPDEKMAVDYGSLKGTDLREKISGLFNVGRATWRGYDAINTPTVQQTAAFAKSMLEEVFGFEGLKGPVDHTTNDHRYRIAWEAKGGRVPVVVAAPDAEVDAFGKALPEFGDGSAGSRSKRSPAVLLQDWLNASDEALWGLAFAGDRIRLMRDNASFTRPAYIEADLGAIFRDEMYADFTALWLLIHASRFGLEGTSPTDCALERWRDAGEQAGTKVRDHLRGNVEQALKVLGQGFLDANPDLRAKLDSGDLSMQDWFNQILRTVYRLIFLAVAEDRNLLHLPETKADIRDLYASNYGFNHWRDRSARRLAYDHHTDNWETLNIVFSALETGAKPLGLPALGGLFKSDQTPDLNGAKLSNRAFLEAVFGLAWFVENNARARINWRDMATEELGSVYESLLELVPIRQNTGLTFTFAEGAQTRQNSRKTSGSYYTPDTLVQTLLDSTLDRALDRSERLGGPEEILKLRILDPACGSGHFLLGAARRMANRLAQGRNIEAPDYQSAMRDVARNCIYGVDRNPMAIELAKVALWIETVTPGKPLGFLDANIVCGDSLFGVSDLRQVEDGLPDEAFTQIKDDDRSICNILRKINRSDKEGQGSFNWGSGFPSSMPPKRMAADVGHLRDLPENTVEEVDAKKARFAEWVIDPKRSATQLACDLYAAAFVLPKSPSEFSSGMPLVPTTASLRLALSGEGLDGQIAAVGQAAAQSASALHWPLVFPEVMIGNGGFDVVISNPPWDVLQNDGKISEDLEERMKEYFKSSCYGVLSGRRDLYKLFLCMIPNILNEQGLAGVISPVGYIVEEDCEGLRNYIWSNGSIDKIFYYQNSKKSFFTSIDSRYRFCISVINKSRIQSHWFSYTIKDPNIKPSLKDGITIDGEGFVAYKQGGYFGEIHNDLALMKAHHNIVNSTSFDRKLSFFLAAEWHATSHKNFAVLPSQADAISVGKNRDIHQFNSDFADASFHVSANDAHVRAKNKGVKLGRNGERILVRDIARSDDTVTLICCISDEKLSSYDTPCVQLHGLTTEFLDEDELLFILGYLNSRYADFIVRPYVDKHIKGYVISRIPVPKMDKSKILFQNVRNIAEKLQVLGKSIGSRVIWDDPFGKEMLIKLDESIAQYLEIRDEDQRIVQSMFPHLYG